MPEASANKQGNFSGPHPLALRLLDALPAGGTVLEIGPGSGRNTSALRAAGVEVTAVPPDAGGLDAFEPRRFDGVLSTHALLHGTPPSIEATVRHAAELMKPGALLYATFGSTRDARFGSGRKISSHTYAPDHGDEAGVAHSYFTDAEVRELLKPLEIVEIAETAVDDVAGKWAHRSAPLAGAVHWFAVAKKPLSDAP